MSKISTIAALSTLAVTASAEIYAGYVTSSDVSEHAKIDLDQKEFEEYLAEDPANFSEAKKIYTDGKNSNKSGNVKRTLQGFADKGASDKFIALNEKLFIQFKAYWASTDGDFADKFALAALDGTGMFQGTEEVFRRECAQKGVAYRNTWMYVVHEMEDAIIDCKAGDQSNNDKGVKAWDEAWVFYTGTLEGADGSGSGKQPYALAEKRCKNFNTCDTNGRADVNNQLLSLFLNGITDLNAGKCGDADIKKASIIKLMAVPLIQGTLRYAFKLDGKTAAERASLSKEIAEGLVFASSVLPILDAADKDAAKLVRTQLYDYQANPVVSYKEVRAAFEDNYATMGVTCEDVGALTAEETGTEAQLICENKNGSAAALSSSALLVAALVAATAALQ